MRRMGRSSRAVWLLGAALFGAPALAGEAFVVFVAAPGYPGSAEQAQPTMDAFAGALARAAGWSAGRVQAIYDNDLESVLGKLGEGAGDLLLAPLPLFVEYGARYRLRPVALAESERGTRASWVLVAGHDAPGDPETLAGHVLHSRAGYAPRFVREVALRDWWWPEADIEIRFTERILGVLRRASAGAPALVLLDGEQAQALDSLPFRDKLRVLHRSPPLPESVVCVRGDAGGERVAAATRALLRLQEDSEARAVLREMRLLGFVRLDETTEGALRRWAGLAAR